jgi:hypothetical protein
MIRYDVSATVHGVALSPDGQTIIGAVGGTGEWSLRTGRIDADIKQAARRKPRARAISTGTGMPLDIVWPAKSSYVFVPCNDHTVRVCQSFSGKTMRTLSGHTDWVYCVASTPDGSKLASGSADGTVKLWNQAAGRELATLVHLSPGSDDWLIVTPQGHYATSSDGAVRWKEAESSTPLKKVPGDLHNPDLVRKALAASTAGPAAAGRRKVSREEMVRRLLKWADKDRDGKLSKKETPKRFQPRFDKLDANSDGFLDPKELAKAMGGGGKRQKQPKKQK